VRLSLLDRSRTRSGRPDAEGLTGTVERAVRADALGYDRFWVAEHHAVPGIASGSPAVLLAAIGARTSRVRIGSGGVMLPQHQPFVVAEQFRVLDALYPGRVDLGLGRSLGFTAPVRRALRQPGTSADGPGDTFEDDLVELRGYLESTGTVTVRPDTGRVVPMWVLATGTGLQVAARLGLPVVVGGPVLGTDHVGDVLATYRRQFRPHAGSAPSVTVSLDVTVADDDLTARGLALPEAWAMARSRQTGEFPPLEPVAAIRGQEWPAQVRRRVDAALDRALAGSPATVRRGLEQLVERTGADELLASTSTYDREALLASDALLRDVVG
jgi:luciferase family oxidoreductase group 1